MDLQPAIRHIRTFFLKRHRMPTYREIARLVGYRSTNAVAKLVGALTGAGLIARDDAGHIIIPNPFGAGRACDGVERSIRAANRSRTARKFSTMRGQ